MAFEVDDEVIYIRKRLLERYKDKSAIIEAASDFVSDSTIYNFFQNRPSQKITDYVKSVLRMFADGNSNTIYHMLNASIGNVTGESLNEEFASKYQGEYTYYRYFQEVNNPAIEYVSGKLILSLDDEVPSFKHISHHHLEDDIVDNSGIVIVSDGRLYMLGWRKSVLRLSSVIPSKDPDNIPSHGIVLSARIGRSDPFSARFLLVRSDNKKMNDYFSDKTEFEKTKNTPKIDKYIKTVGEQNFRKFWRDNVYFMLGSHT